MSYAGVESNEEYMRQTLREIDSARARRRWEDSLEGRAELHRQEVERARSLVASCEHAIEHHREAVKAARKRLTQLRAELARLEASSQ